MNNDVARLGLIHTVPALGPVFHDLLTDAAARIGTEVEPIHLTDPWMLRTAMSAGVTPDVMDRLSAHVGHLARREVAGVLVTCSSLGEATEQLATGQGASPVPVLRIDRAMAERAVGLAGDGGRIAVLATASSTVGPTRRLIEHTAEGAKLDVHVDVEVIEAAAAARASGDHQQHDALVADAVVRWARPERADVVLLAQASMAHLAQSTSTTGAAYDVPVLGSPTLAVESLLNAARLAPSPSPPSSPSPSSPPAPRP